MINSTNAYYLTAFFEGGLVMAFELVVARLLAPYFGSTIYVLTSILGVTMLALLIGYFIGGRFVKYGFGVRLPFVLIVIASCLMCLIVPLSGLILLISMNLGLIGGSIFSSVVLLGLPLVCLGTTSSLFVQLINESGPKAGTASGNVYAISTMGGVIGTFIVGLFLIPKFGIRTTSFSIGVFIVISVLLILFFKTKQRIITAKLLWLFITILIFSAYTDDISKPNIDKCIYSSDGLLGRLDVCEFSKDILVLSNNGIDQSRVRMIDDFSLMTYTHVVATAASFVRPINRNKALLIGLAGGSLVKEIQQMGFRDVTAVDIDPRTKYVSDKFFNLNPNSYKFVADDGRHFITNSKDVYDLIIVDVSESEQQPYHLYTREAFNIYRDHLSKDGLIVLNIIDFAGEQAEILENIGNSMSMLNLSPRMLKEFYPIHKMDQSKIYTHIHERIIIGSKNGYFNLSESQNEMNTCCQLIDYNLSLKQNLKENSYARLNETGIGFVDDIPTMEKINFYRIYKLRNKKFIQNQSKKLFN